MAPEESMPDLAFLEFLGQFETEQGHWIEPTALLEEEFSQLLQAVSAAAEVQQDSSDQAEAQQ